MQLDVFVIMPDHVHGILAIGGGQDTRRSALRLGAIVRSFKSAVSKRINEMRRTSGAPVWQRNYFDRIIRDSGELNRARWYIQANASRLAALAKR